MSIFASMFIREIGLMFSFLVISLPALCIRGTVASQDEFGGVLSVPLLCNNLRGIGINSSLNLLIEFCSKPI